MTAAQCWRITLFRSWLGDHKPVWKVYPLIAFTNLAPSFAPLRTWHTAQVSLSHHSQDPRVHIFVQIPTELRWWDAIIKPTYTIRTPGNAFMVIWWSNNYKGTISHLSRGIHTQHKRRHVKSNEERVSSVLHKHTLTCRRRQIKAIKRRIQNDYRIRIVHTCSNYLFFLGLSDGRWPRDISRYV